METGGAMSKEAANQAPEPPRRDPRQPADFDPVALGRVLLRAIRIGALGTLDPAGAPFVSLTSVATDLDGAPLILISGLSAHTRNLGADPRCSLMLSEGGKGDPLAHPRLTLQCRAGRAEGDVIRRRFLARHPKAKLYVDFPDFAFMRLAPVTMHLNGGFARAFEGDARLILSPEAAEPGFAALEAGAIEHMNADHADALALYATALAGERTGPWRASGLDPHGLDLILGDRTARIAFPNPVTTAGDLRMLLKRLADEARIASGAAGPDIAGR
jgi:hypothetical protein